MDPLIDELLERARRGDPEGSIRLLALLRAPDPAQRSDAAEALARIGDGAAGDPLIAVLGSDPDPVVRASAAEALGDLGVPRALAALKAALADPDDAVRGYAANAIGLLGDAQDLAFLAAHAEHETSSRVRAELCGAASRLGDAKAVTRLTAMLHAADEHLATNIVNILADLASRRTPPDLANAASIAALRGAQRRFDLLKTDIDRLLDRLLPSAGGAS